MKKRILSLLLVLIMVLGMFPMSAMATETDTVYISASHDGVYLDGMAYTAVPLSALEEIDLTEWGLGEGAEDNGGYDFRYDADGDGTYEITALHLAIYAHKYICGQSNTDVLEPSQTSGPNGIFFGAIFGFEGDGNLRYDFNGAYPADETGWGLTADRIVLKDGDYIDFAHYSDWNFYSDSAYGFNYFADGSEGNWSVTHAYTATAGEELTVTLGRVVSDWMTNTSELVPVSSSSYMDAEGNYPPVYYGSAVGVTDADTAALNENGQATITFSEAGTYYVWANGGYGVDNAYGVPVSAPACAEVTVTAPACEHSWTDATCSAPKTCSKCDATEGEVDPEAHKYVDGTCEYCNKPDPNAAVVLPFTATADGEAVEIIDLDETADCWGITAHKLSVTAPAGTDTLTISVVGDNTVDYVYGDKNDSEKTSLDYPVNVSMDDGYVYLCFTMNDESVAYHIYLYEAECEHNYINGICEYCEAPVCEADPDAHSFVDGACEYCGKSEIEPTPIVNADGNSIEWPYRGCNINKVIVNNVKVDGFTQNGSNYYITLNSAVADDAAVELTIGTFLNYSNLWVLVDDQCITESPVSATTELPYTVQLENGTATVKIGGCPGYNTGSYIQQYAVNKTFYFSTGGQFPIAPMLNGGSTTSALRVENDTWSADLSAVFKNISDKEVTYKVAIDGAEAVECDADYTYTCDAPGTRKLVFTAVNDYGTSPNYTATISVLPAESIQEVNYEVQGGTITWFAFTDDQLNALPEGTTYEWDAETTTWTIIQPADINVTGKVITYYNLVKDDPNAKLPLLSGSNAVAGAGTKWDGAVRNQQTNTLSNGAVSTYVYLFEKTPTSTSEDQYTLIRFNYDRQKPETYFEYSVTGNAELTIVGDVGGVNGHQWTGDREVHVALNNTTPTDAVISCVEKSNSVTLSDGTGQFSYKTGNWWEEKTWYVKYKIDQFPTLINSDKTSEDVTIPALETYTLDLTTVFTDPDENDTLSYQVKLNDGSWTNIESSQYSYTPESAQDYVLTFRAYDGFVYSDVYTVNLTATNATETYTVTVTARENVLFYCTAEFAEGVDSLGTPIDASYADGVYTLSVPVNVSRISWRMDEIGMSTEVEADAALTLMEANFKVMAGEAEDTGALTVKYGDYVAVGPENSYLLLDGAEYSYAVTPADTLYRAYNESGKTPVSGENVIELTLKHITVIAPAGSTVSSGRFYSYFRYDFNEAQKTTSLDDGRISVDFPVPGSEAFIRVQHPDGVTYWDFGGLSDGTTVEVTEAMLFIGSEALRKEVSAQGRLKRGSICSLFRLISR